MNIIINIVYAGVVNMKNIVLFVVILSALFFNGCANRPNINNIMEFKANDTVCQIYECYKRVNQYLEPAILTKEDMILLTDEAAIVFLRPHLAGYAIQAPIAERVGNSLKFVTILSIKTKVFYKTTPDKHYFVVGGENGYLLEADLAGGKTYYAYIKPEWGNWKGRFSFEPVKDTEINTQEFIDDLELCNWYQNRAESETWFMINLSSMEDKYTYALQEHKTLPTEEEALQNFENQKQQLEEKKRFDPVGNVNEKAVMPKYKKIIKPEYGI
jgi:hypothetical protein